MAEQEPKKEQTPEKPPVEEGVTDKEEVSPETRRSIARLLFGGFIRIDYSDPKKEEKI